MRTIPEVVEDIKSILNNIERTEECNGETLVDINELADEILSIDCYMDKPHTNADRIRSMSDEELADFLCRYFTCEYECAARTENCMRDCGGAVIKWIQSEAEE